MNTQQTQLTGTVSAQGIRYNGEGRMDGWIEWAVIETPYDEDLGDTDLGDAAELDAFVFATLPGIYVKQADGLSIFYCRPPSVRIVGSRILVKQECGYDVSYTKAVAA